MSRLTVDGVRELTGQDVRKVKILNVSNKGFKYIENLSPCLELQRADLSRNCLSNFKGIADCSTLTWMNLAHNQIESLKPVCKLTNLIVLNAAHNNLVKCGDLSPLVNLKALILNNNQLTVIQGLAKLTQLNTLVLSHNCFELVEVKSLTSLSKLSVSHNVLRQVPNTESNHELVELRLNGNKITELPSSLQNNTRLSLLDVGNNRIKSFRSIEVLRNIKSLRSLNMKGNKICEEGIYQDTIKEMVDSLQVFDSQRVTAESTQGVRQAIKTQTQWSYEEAESSGADQGGSESEKKCEKTSQLTQLTHLNSESSYVSAAASVTERGEELMVSKKKRPRGKSGVVSVKCVKRIRAKFETDPLIIADLETVVSRVGEGGTPSWN